MLIPLAINLGAAFIYCHVLTTATHFSRLCHTRPWRHCNGLLTQQHDLSAIYGHENHVTPALIELHWLPIEARVQYKLCLLVHIATIGKAPDYMSKLLQPVSGVSSRRIQSYDRPAMNNYSYHARDWSSVSELSVYQLHEHGTVFLSTFAPPATPLPSRRNCKLKTFLFRKAFQLPSPCSLDYHSLTVHYLFRAGQLLP